LYIGTNALIFLGSWVDKEFIVKCTGDEPLPLCLRRALMIETNVALLSGNRREEFGTCDKTLSGAENALIPVFSLVIAPKNPITIFKRLG